MRFHASRISALSAACSERACLPGKEELIIWVNLDNKSLVNMLPLQSFQPGRICSISIENALSPIQGLNNLPEIHLLVIA